MAEHLALQTEENLLAGMSPAEARRQAALKLGAAQAIREHHNAEQGLPLAENFPLDIRYAFRMLYRSPGFALFAIATMALGVGATTAIYSVIDATLLHPLPFPNPSELVRIEDDLPGVGAQDVSVSIPEWKDLENSGIFQYVAIDFFGSVNLTGSAQPARIALKGVTPNYFAMLGVGAQLGRTFDPGDNTPGVNLEVVISDGLWKRAFGADPRILGKTVRLDNLPRPTLLLVNGFDGSQEEILHAVGFSALERGFNVFTFEGPGQTAVVRAQGLGFIAEWERVVTPVVDYCEKLACADASRIALLGYSFGGYLAPRAAAFEHRLAAVVCVDGRFDIYQAFSGALPAELKRLLDEKKVDALNQAVAMGMTQNTHLRWAVEHGSWAFRAKTPYEFLECTRNMTMPGLTDQIQCPVLVCNAENDQFFRGQPEQRAVALGPRALHRKLTVADAAGEHCHVGASDVVSRIVMDWVEDRIARVR